MGHLLVAWSPAGQNDLQTVSGTIRDTLREKCEGYVMPDEREGQNGERVRLLDVRAAARYLGTTDKTLYQKVWRREIAFIKIGRSVRFDIRDLETLIEQSRVEADEI